MYIKSREESLADLSEKLSDVQLKKAITQGYSDISLSEISRYKKEYAAVFFDSQYSASTINKLTEAYAKDKLTPSDLFQVIKYTPYNARNEPYVDDFLKSIDNGFYRETAVRTFSAVLYEKCSYKEAMEYVKSGAFRPTEYASLSVTSEVAKQLDDMHVSLRACEGFNYCYDINNLQEALDRGAAILVQDKDVAVKVCEYMKQPDWYDFRNKVLEELGGDIANLTGSKLEKLHTQYALFQRSDNLYDRLQKEFMALLKERKDKGENHIDSSYEVLTKDDIVEFFNRYAPDISEKQYNALMSSKNTLDEIYKEWCRNGELECLEDVVIAVTEAADRIQISLDREKQEKLTTEKNKAIPAQEQDVKQKHKSR